MAPLPPRIINKSLVSDDVIIDTVVSKYGDHCPLYRQSAILLRDAGFAVDELHGKEWLQAETGTGRARVIYLRYSRVVEAAQRLELPLEAAKELGARPRTLDDLQCDPSLRLVLLGFIYGAHASRAKQANDAISANTCR